MSAKFNAQTLKHTVYYDKKGKKEVLQEVEYPEALKAVANELSLKYSKLRTIVVSEDPVEIVVVRAPDKVEFDKMNAAQTRAYLAEDDGNGIEQAQTVRRNMAQAFVVFPPLDEYIALDADIPGLAFSVCDAAAECSRDLSVRLGKAR